MNYNFEFFFILLTISNFAKSHLMTLPKKYLKHFLFIVSVIVLYMAVNIRWGGDEKWMRIVQADGRGYYGNLPAIFIYDLSYNFFYEVEDVKMTVPKYNYVRGFKDHMYNKYYLGTAIMESPFFLTAHLASHIFNKPTDGYSKLYFKFINISSIFYLILGLWFLGRFLRYYHINEITMLLILTFILFGTNLLYYSVYESSLSHVYSFSLFSAFAYYAHKFFHYFRKRYIIYLGAILGLVVVVRPINGILILSLPIFAGSTEMMKLAIEKIRINLFPLLLGVIAGSLFIFAQLLVYKIGTGHWFIYTYQHESGFDLDGRNFIPFLFSYKKGLFLYTPMYLISMLLGLFFLFKNKFRYLSWLLFLLFSIYILSSWHVWYYGGSFSSRVMVEFLPFFALPLGVALSKIKSLYGRIPLITLLVLTTIFCLFQMYQFDHGLIHYAEMTKEDYWRVFLLMP